MPADAGQPQHSRGLVFISHEKSDDGLAHEIRDHLAAGGFACWMAPDDIGGPIPWPEQIAQAIDNCDVMLVVVSAHANRSPHVSREVDLAVEKGKPLLPVRVEDIVPSGSLEYLLRLAQWIDLFPGSLADHATSLQVMVGSMLGERSPFAPTSAPPSTVEPEPHRHAMRHVSRRMLVAGGALMVALIAAIALIAALQGDDQPTAQGDDEPSTETNDPTADEDDEPSMEARDPTADVDDGLERYTRVSVASDGSEANDHSVNPSISADGRYVAFDSLASNLVGNDSGEWRDVFVHDRETGETIRISEVVSDSGFLEEAFGSSRDPQISADGNRVIYVSDAPNLVPFGDDQNDASDIFMWNRATGETTLISRNADGRPLHALNSIDPAMSDDGTLIAYATYDGDRTPTYLDGGTYSVWVVDSLPSPDSTVPGPIAAYDAGGEGVTVAPPAVSADGSTVIANGHHGGVHIYDRASGEAEVVDDLWGVIFDSLALSPDGTAVLFSSSKDHLVAEDLNASEDLFSYDRRSGMFDRILENPWGAGLRLVDVGTGGLCVTFSHTDGPGGVVCNGTVVPVGVAGVDFGDVALSLSDDGPFVAFSHPSDELVEGDTNGKQDIFVTELQLGELIDEPDASTDDADAGVPAEVPEPSPEPVDEVATLVSVAYDGSPADDHSVNPSISADGRYVAFDSLASNLADNDSGRFRDVFVHDRETGETTRVSQIVFGERIEEGNSGSSHPSISGNGRYVVYQSSATNLDADRDQATNLYLYDRETSRNRQIGFNQAGGEHPQEPIHADISDDGTMITYATFPGGQLPPEGVTATPLDERGTNYEVWVHDTISGTTTLVISVDLSVMLAPMHGPQVTPDGGFVWVESGTGGTFVFERATGTVTDLGLGATEVSYLVPFPDGNRIAFTSGNALVADDVNGVDDAYVYDRSTGQFRLLAEFGPDWGGRPSSITSDGRYLAIAGPGNAPRVIDTTDGEIATELSASLGLQRLDLSGDGRWATFNSASDGLVDGDTNGKQDVFVIQLEE